MTKRSLLPALLAVSAIGCGVPVDDGSTDSVEDAVMCKDSRTETAIVVNKIVKTWSAVVTADSRLSDFAADAQAGSCSSPTLYSVTDGAAFYVTACPTAAAASLVTEYRNEIPEEAVNLYQAASHKIGGYKTVTVTTCRSGQPPLKTQFTYYAEASATLGSPGTGRSWVKFDPRCGNC